MATRKRAEHGTDGGYFAHYRTWKTPVCQPCRDAHKLAMAEYRERKRREAEAARTGKHLTLVPPAPDEFGEPIADPDAPPGPIEVALRREMQGITGDFQWKDTLCAVSIRMAKHLDEGRPDIASAATGRLTELLDRLWPKMKDGPSGKVFALGDLAEPD